MLERTISRKVVEWLYGHGIIERSESNIYVYKENLKLTPIFVKNRIPYIRNENNGCITIALPEKRIPQYKILNKSAVEFSDLMDGTNTVQMILDLLAKKYGENHRTAITADMGIVLSTFLSLKLIIFKKGEFPTMDGITMPLNDKLVVKFAFEHDLNNIVLALDSVKTSDNFTFSSPLAYNAILAILLMNILWNDFRFEVRKDETRQTVPCKNFVFDRNCRRIIDSQ